jgi:nucleoside 2-deoxyribosyltransferase
MPGILHTAIKRKRIYLANPYGFSKQWKALLPPIIQALDALGLDVWEPFARSAQRGFAEPGQAYQISQTNFQHLRKSHAIFAVVNGAPPDEKVMVELGMAIALGMPSFLFRDDVRHWADNEEYPLNLVLFTGIPRDNWQGYYYTSVAEIGAPEKALARWAAGKL